MRLTILSAVVLLLVGVGPCGRIPGGMLTAQVSTVAVDDWAFVNDQAGTCAIEVRIEDPHSVSVNCMAVGKDLYVGCSNCTGKKWSALALEDPRARIQIGELVYPVNLRRIEESDEIAAVWLVRGKNTLAG